MKAVTNRDIAPVFVVGTTRSGTSVVQLALLASGRYQGGGEGHVSPLLTLLVSAVDQFWLQAESAIRADAEVARLRKEDVLKRVYEVVRATYADLYGDQNFAAKTPTIDAIRATPWLHKVWPNVKIVFCRRRGLENVQSKRIKFPGLSFTTACAEWRDCMLEWHEIRSRVPTYCEIDQFEIAHAPVATAKRLGSYLGFSDEEIKVLGDFFEQRFPERSGADYEPLAIDEMTWTAEERAEFRRVCDSVMQTYGYCYDSSYWTDAKPTEVASSD